MRVDAFDFVLAPESIALSPANPRDSARMLVVGPDGGFADAYVRDLPDLLTSRDALVVNDTRVIERNPDGAEIIPGFCPALVDAKLFEHGKRKSF